MKISTDATNCHDISLTDEQLEYYGLSESNIAEYYHILDTSGICESFEPIQTTLGSLEGALFIKNISEQLQCDVEIIDDSHDIFGSIFKEIDKLYDGI
jgi:hypothetical protein